MVILVIVIPIYGIFQVLKITHLQLQIFNLLQLYQEIILYFLPLQVPTIVLLQIALPLLFTRNPQLLKLFWRVYPRALRRGNMCIRRNATMEQWFSRYRSILLQRWLSLCLLYRPYHRLSFRKSIRLYRASPQLRCATDRLLRNMLRFINTSASGVWFLSLSCIAISMVLVPRPHTHYARN